MRSALLLGLLAGCATAPPTLDGLGDPDLLTRWETTHALLRRPSADYAPQLLDTLPSLDPVALRQALKLLDRAKIDVDPARLAFLESRDPALREAGAAILVRSSRPVEALRLAVRFVSRDVHIATARDLILRFDRAVVVAEFPKSLQALLCGDLLASALAEEPSIAPLAVSFAEHHAVAEALQTTSSPVLLAAALEALADVSRHPSLHDAILRALARNPHLPDDRRTGFPLAPTFELLLERDAVGAAAWLSRLPAADAWEACSAAFDRGYDGSLERAYERRLGALLSVPHEAVRQRTALELLQHRVEPHLADAERVFREATALGLDERTLGWLWHLRPDLAAPLIRIGLQTAARDSELMGRLLLCAIHERTPEAAAILRGRFGNELETDERFLRLVAWSPREEDRAFLLAASKSDDGRQRSVGAFGLVRLGDADALPLLLGNLQGFPPEDLDKGYPDLDDHPGRLLPRMGRRMAEALRTSIPRERLLQAAASLPLENADPFLAPLLGELGARDELVRRADALSAGRTGQAYLRAIEPLAGDAVTAVLYRLAHKGRGDVALEALAALAAREDPGLLDLLLELSRSEERQELALPMLCDWGPRGLVEAVLPLVGSSRRPEQILAARVLVRHAPDRAETRHVLEHLLLTPDGLPWEPFHVYLKTHPDALEDSVVRMSASASALVRRNAVGLRTAWGRPEDARKLVPFIDDPDPEVVSDAAWTLGVLRSADAARSALRRLNSDPTLAGSPTGRPLVGLRFLLEGSERREFERFAPSFDEKFVLFREISHGSSDAFRLLLRAWDRDANRSPNSALWNLTGVEIRGGADEWAEWLTGLDAPFVPRPLPDSFVSLEFGFPRRPPPATFPGAAITSFGKVREWRGAIEEIGALGTFAVRDAATWKTLWRRLRRPAPPADFGRETGIVIAREDPDPAYSRGFWTTLLGFERRDGETRVYAECDQDEIGYAVVEHGGTGWHVALVPRIDTPVRIITADRAR